MPAHAGTHPWAWAVLAGAGSAAGLSLMYRALRGGKVGVVAPIASTEGAIAAVISIGLGEQLTLGVAVCLIVVAARRRAGDAARVGRPTSTCGRRCTRSGRRACSA